MAERRMEKFFNTAGPGKEYLNYMVDPLRRVNYDDIITLIGRERYFVLHAPRQTGKTTSLLAMVEKINGGDRYCCVYMNVEPAQTARNDVEAGMKAILSSFASSAGMFLGIDLPTGFIAPIIAEYGAHAAFGRVLEDFCKKISKPLVLFIDEIDALIGDTLVSVLRQLRDGYAKRPRNFPISIILCGVRDIRDYRIHSSGGEIITGGSCFNVKAESLRLGDFSRYDIRELYLQHTAETGQPFEEDVYPKVWDLTYGQPWLVNALADHATSKMPEGRDRNQPITLDLISEASNQLILERATHLDQLADKLTEPRVQSVLGSLLAGENWETNPSEDDIQYVIDLGLMRRDETKTLVVSNGIYREVLPRQI